MVDMVTGAVVDPLQFTTGTLTFNSPSDHTALLESLSDAADLLLPRLQTEDGSSDLLEESLHSPASTGSSGIGQDAGQMTTPVEPSVDPFPEHSMALTRGFDTRWASQLPWELTLACKSIADTSALICRLFSSMQRFKNIVTNIAREFQSMDYKIMYRSSFSDTTRLRNILTRPSSRAWIMRPENRVINHCRRNVRNWRCTSIRISSTSKISSCKFKFNCSSRSKPPRRRTSNSSSIRVF